MTKHALARFICIVALVSMFAGTVNAQRSPQAVTWHTAIVEPLGLSGQGNSIALDSHSLPRISYGGHGGDYHFGLKYTAYDGAAWQAQMLDEQMSPGWPTSLALDALDNPHIAYHDPHQALMYAHYYNNSWHIQLVEGGQDVGENAALKLDAAGWPHIAYTDETSHTIKYAHRTGADWQIETVITATSSSQSFALDMALDSADRPRLCFYDYEINKVKYAYRDGAGWHFQVLDNDVFLNGPNCSIKLDAQDRPRIAYRDLGLYYVAYDGSSWHSTLVDHNMSAGYHLALALDHSDRPRIAYSNVPDSQLNYAYFDGLDWQIEPIATGQRYEDLSLALDWADRPHISYYNLTTSNLMYAGQGISSIHSQVYLPLMQR